MQEFSCFNCEPKESNSGGKAAFLAKLKSSEPQAEIAFSPRV